MDWISVKKRLPVNYPMAKARGLRATRSMIGQVVCIAYDGLTNKTTGEEK